MSEIYQSSREYISLLSAGTIANMLSDLLGRRLEEHEKTYDFLDALRERASLFASDTTYDINNVRQSILDAYYDVINHPKHIIEHDHLI